MNWYESKTADIEFTHDELVLLLDNLSMTVETARSEETAAAYVELRDRLRSAERQIRGRD